MKYFIMISLLGWAGLVHSDSFKDADLQALLEANKTDHRKIVIYAWSPHMALSQRGLDEILMFKKNGGYECSWGLRPHHLKRKYDLISQTWV